MLSQMAFVWYSDNTPRVQFNLFLGTFIEKQHPNHYLPSNFFWLRWSKTLYSTRRTWLWGASVYVQTSALFTEIKCIVWYLDLE